jgi:predicted CopG family antitoxin
MSKRTTILLDEDIYRRLVEESLRKHGTTKAISKVVNELLKKALKNREEILDLLLSKKVAKTSVKEFENFRRELSRRFES